MASISPGGAYLHYYYADMCLLSSLYLALFTVWRVSCELTTSSAMYAPFTLRMLTATCAYPTTTTPYVVSLSLYLRSNIVELDPKKQSKSKRGVADVQEPQRARGYQPYSTSAPHHHRSASEAVTEYDFSQPPQAQPQAFFAHGQGQRYGAYGKVVHRPKASIPYRVAWRRYRTSACGLCGRRRLRLFGTLGRWKTRRWEDPSSRLLNIFVLVLSRIMKTGASMPMHTRTLARKPKFEIHCIPHHVSGVRWICQSRTTLND